MSTVLVPSSTAATMDIPSSVANVSSDDVPLPITDGVGCVKPTTTRADVLDKRTLACDPQSIVILEPLQYDILCGQDKTWSNHYGNQMFRNQIMEHLPTYRTANKKVKMTLTKQIINTLKSQYNARFIRPAKQNDNQNDVWELITDQLARDKVSHALRFALKQSVRSANSTSESIVSTSTSASSASSVCSKTIKTSRQTMQLPSKALQLPPILSFDNDDEYADDLEPLPLSASILLPPPSNRSANHSNTCSQSPDENHHEASAERDEGDEGEAVLLFRRQQTLLDQLKHQMQQQDIQQQREQQQYVDSSVNEPVNRQSELEDTFGGDDALFSPASNSLEGNVNVSQTVEAVQTPTEEEVTDSFPEPYDIDFHSLAIFDDLIAQPLMILESGSEDMYSSPFVATVVPEGVVYCEASVEAIDIPYGYEKRKHVDVVSSYYQDVVAVATVMDLDGNSIAGANPPKLNKMVPPPIPFGKKFGASTPLRQKSDESFDLSFLDRIESMSSIEGLRTRTRSMERVESTSSSDCFRTRTRSMSLTDFNLDWILPPPSCNNNSNGNLNISSNDSIGSSSMT